MYLEVGAYDTGTRLLGLDSPKGYYDIPKSKQAGIAVSYAVLVLGLITAMKLNDENRKTPLEIKKKHESEGIESDEMFTLYSEYFDKDGNFIADSDNDDKWW